MTSNIMLSSLSVTGVAEFLSSTLFRFFLLPLLTVVLSVFVKAASRNDRYSKFGKVDFAVGLEIAQIAMIAFVVYSVSIAGRIVATGNSVLHDSTVIREKMLITPWLIMALVFGLWGVSTLMRKFGWKSEDEPTWFFGIIVPFLYGLIALTFVSIWTG